VTDSSGEQQTLDGARANFDDSEKTECPYCNDVVYGVELYAHLARCGGRE
jgi:hypothetical protein